MIPTTLASAAAATSAPAMPTAAAAARPRLDLYQPIHKGLRAFLGNTLLRLGAMDIDDAADRAATLAQVDGLLGLARLHAEFENRYLHPAIESRRPGATARVAAEHAEHLASVEALQSEVAALRAEPGAERALRVYRHFALFMAENLEHMHFEETVLNAALWATHDDDELERIHQQLLAAVPAPEMMQVLRWMLPALDPAARAGVLAGMQTRMPPENFRDLLDQMVRRVLDEAAWAKLTRALGLPPVPGLIEA